MYYLVNGEIKRGKQLPNNAYKNYSFVTLEEARNFKNYVLNTEFDKMNFRYNDFIKKEFHLQEELKKILLENNELNKILSNNYSNSFFKSQEWIERDKINKEYLKLNREYNALLFETTEILSKDVLENHDYFNSNKHFIICNMLNSEHPFHYKNYNFTEENQKILKDFIKDRNILNEKIKKCVFDYNRIQKETDLKDNYLNEIKNKILKNTSKVIHLKQEIQKNNSINRFLNSDEKVFLIKLKDLNTKDIVYNKTFDFYNLIHFSETKKYFRIIDVPRFRERYALIRETVELLENDSLIIVDKNVKGELLKEDLPFENLFEFQDKKKILKDARGGKDLRSFYGRKGIINKGHDKY